ncbi:LPXTG cell wall anchor domain-containing protein [Enterococcus cecorum]|nr:LPXTG cell wall anchor domain-containing protein [Enterococcus cecorum]MCJ0559478.1 LPXTG cell wall anchor domain-containing protein [Enterococcus cecorum]MCJ0599126.1 LPXTG cell wall anchor domain-containing protein [Enterococcus cecorum]MCJ0602612.1 LPXTG cell wall anchor domain-containing protein [Enterococcus cecorum]
MPAAKTKAKNDLPAAGTKQNGYLWLGVVSLGLAGIMIYFDRKSRWHY